MAGGAWSRLLAWLRAPGDPPAPDALVVLTTVPIVEGPMTVALLERHGITAYGREVFPRGRSGSFRPGYVVEVPYALFDEAAAVLERGV